MVNVTPAQQAAIVDEYGELERQLGQYAHIAKRANELRKKIESWFANEEPDKTYLVDGKLYRAIVGQRATRRVISNMKKLFDTLGVKSFLENCTFSLTSLDRMQIDTAGILSEDRTGPRTVAAVLKAPPAPKPKAKRTRTQAAPQPEVVVEQ